MKTFIWVMLLLTAGGAAGGWWAYQEGHIGTNPNAPTLRNFKPIVDAWAFRKGELKPKCIAASPDSAPGSRRGRPGWSSIDTMGLGVTTLALRTPSSSQQLMRDRALLRFDALAKEGFFAVSDAQLQLETGETVPAREYVLTQKGWENSYGNCFYAGRPEVLEVVSFARVQPDPDGVRAYEVTYRIGARTVPAWADSEQAREIFGDLKNHRSVEEKRLRLLRGEKGWLPEPAVKTKEGVLDRSRLSQSLDQLMPPITPAQIVELGKDHEFLRDPRVCVLLPRTRGHDADEIEWSLSGPVSIALYEADAITNPVSRIRESWVPRMINLTRAGLFREASIPADAMRNRPPGVRYTLEEKYLPHISKTGAGCIRLGPMKVDILPDTIEVQGRQDGTLNYNFKAVGRIAADSWAREVSWAGIPEAEAYLGHGVPISGSVEFKDGNWRLAHAGAGTPVIVEPPRREPGAADWSNGPSPLRGIDQPNRLTAPPPPSGSVHVFAVYQAPRNSGTEGRIRVDVGARKRPLTLVLSAYESVHWRVWADPGAQIDKVIVMGHHPGRVSGVSPDRVQRVNGYLRDFGTGGSRRRGSDPRVTADTVERLVGRRPDSVDGAYEADYFSLGSTRAPPISPTAERRAPWSTDAGGVPVPRQVIIAPGQRR